MILMLSLLRLPCMPRLTLLETFQNSLMDGIHVLGAISWQLEGLKARQILVGHSQTFLYVLQTEPN